MLYLVTGGAGFIGSHLAAALVQRGHRVRVLDNFSTGSRRNLAHVISDVEIIEGDLLDGAAVHRAVAGVEVVFHQAALASVPRSLESPLATHSACATGTLELLEAARRAQVKRVVYAGSSSAYGNQPFSSKREADPHGPLSPYAAAKLAGEFYCRAYAESLGLETVVIRYFNVFGPRQDPASEYAAVIPRFVTAMLAGRRPVIYGNGRQSRDFTYIDNVVNGNLLAADAAPAAGQVYNVACGRQISLIDLVGCINRTLGTKLSPQFAPARTGDVHDSLADISAARRDLGYEPLIHFEDGLQRTIDYYRAALQ